MSLKKASLIIEVEMAPLKLNVINQGDFFVELYFIKAEFKIPLFQIQI
jgi:hypothetical protein